MPLFRKTDDLPGVFISDFFILNVYKSVLDTLNIYFQLLVTTFATGFQNLQGGRHRVDGDHRIALSR